MVLLRGRLILLVTTDTDTGGAVENSKDSPGFVLYNIALIVGLVVLSILRGKNNQKLNDVADWCERNLGMKH